MTGKTRIVKYLSENPDRLIVGHRVYVIFQYFVIYFNLVIQDTIKRFKAVGDSLQNLFPSYWKVIVTKWN